ncbi:hypothetical protein [Paenibacillus methanolicus]|uniref:DUF4367 domain-containing protein n=1 Tax=Paenibacillus methanolicus TaxID=582686 RepID=A0A5S5C8A4_9BACL|nr:hypothetical protein [Paenibacillus methanolicus]TYP74560.1 hypothetical protein BCM02_105104 [Paenibacillus methanolicus]
MTDREHELRRQFREESDDMLFSGMEMSEQLKRRIRQEAVGGKAVRKRTLATSWKVGAAGLVAAAMIVVAIPLLDQSSVPAPGNQVAENVPPAQNHGGAAGSDVTQLTTTPLGSIDEAKAAFGEGLRLPTVVPQGYALKEMSAVGMPGQPARDILFTYASGEQTVTFTASRMAPAYPAELFTKTKVGDAEGAIFEQPGMTELFWTADGVHYGVTGPITGEEAMKVSTSAEL